MPELRKHYFLDEYCIIARQSARRGRLISSSQRRSRRRDRLPILSGKRGDDSTRRWQSTLKQGVLSDGPERISGWQLRVFPNVFAAMVPCPAPATTEWIALPGQGFHEVIVDSPQHRENPADFAQEHMEKLIQVYRDRYVHYCGNSLVKYVSIFKNWGKEAGASLSHSHSQLITLPILPPLIKRELDAISRAITLSVLQYRSAREGVMPAHRRERKLDSNCTLLFSGTL